MFGKFVTLNLPMEDVSQLEDAQNLSLCLDDLKTALSI